MNLCEPLLEGNTVTNEIHDVADFISNFVPQNGEDRMPESYTIEVA
jgi:hypothetical protein